MPYIIEKSPEQIYGDPKADWLTWIKLDTDTYAQIRIGCQATEDQAKAFIRQTAAAPDMLAALRTIDTQLESIMEEPAYNAVSEAHDLVKAVIAFVS